MSELAFKLITENKKTCSPFLDLGDCDLTHVPEGIGELVWLEELSFAGVRGYFDHTKWVTKFTQNKGRRNNIRSLLPSTLFKPESLVNKYDNLSPFSKLIKLKKLYLI
ncbi:MAG: hypothetical protein WC856_13995 [Methylococcaceae bacterium]